MDKVKKGEPVKLLKTQRLTKDGRVLDVWLTATALKDDSGQPIEIATTERDLAWLPSGN
jgi:two-component system CheB/CheR fusion protein